MKSNVNSPLVRCLKMLIFASGFAILIGSWCHASDRNIVFFITDDEGPTLGCYGDSVAVSPNVDALAKDGVVFKNAFATTASCSASRSVVLSGLHNHKNGQYGHQHHFHKFFISHKYLLDKELFKLFHYDSNLI